MGRFDEDAIEDRLSAALHSQNPNPHRFAQLVENIKLKQVFRSLNLMKLRERPKGRPVLIFELDRSLLEGSSEVESLSSAAQKFEDASAE